MSVPIPIFLPQCLREAYFLTIVLFLKMSLRLSRTVAVPGIAQPKEHILLFYSDIFKRGKNTKRNTNVLVPFTPGFKPPGAELDSLYVCLSFSLSVCLLNSPRLQIVVVVETG